MNEVISQATLSLVEELQAGAESFAFSGVKAEFEAEGSRIEDLKILLFAGKQAGLETIVKIGGCEALRDMRDLASLGRVENVVAPMIESAFALQKFISMASRVREEYGFAPNLYFNLETVDAWSKFDEILSVAQDSGQITGVTFGRGDFAQSLGLPRSAVESKEVSDAVFAACEMTVEKGLNFCVGGSISSGSTEVLRSLKALGAHAFETRKISWHFSTIPDSNQEFASQLESGLQFELSWLESKRARYERMAHEDDSRRMQLLNRFGKAKADQ